MKFIDHFTSFTLSERRGVLALILIIIVVYVFRKYRESFHATQAIVHDEQFLAEVNGFVKATQQNASYQNIHFKRSATKSEKRDKSLFKFNPNEVSEKQLLQLGFSKYVTGNILKYRRKGGVFSHQGDLAKIYGMEKDFFDKVKDYIEIPEKHLETAQNDTSQSTEIMEVVVDINLANREALMKVYGIGEYFAERIVEYRKELGGYISMHQLKEIYGLDSLKYQELYGKLTIGDTSLSKMNLNSLTAKEFIRHPYIDNWKLANAIEKYRIQHGPYSSVQELKNIKLVTDSIYEKLKPYLSIK